MSSHAMPQARNPARAHAHSHEIPRAPIVAAGAMVLVALLAVGGAQLAGLAPNDATPKAVSAMVETRFEDRADGAVLVRDARSGALLAVVDPGTQGFLRGALRALVRERRQHGLGAEQPFRVLAHPDGRLTLHDPATGRNLDLLAFGPTNAALFARLLAPGPAPAGR